MQHEGFRLDIHVWERTVKHWDVGSKQSCGTFFGHLKEKGRWFYFNAFYTAPPRERRMNPAIAGDHFSSVIHER